MLRKPVITASIVGAGKRQHFDDALAAVDLPRSEDEIAALEGHYRPRPATLWLQK
jgi:aryl-alcohol dehydrogenase-like predicted oxidoreductase